MKAGFIGKEAGYHLCDPNNVRALSILSMKFWLPVMIGRSVPMPTARHCPRRFVADANRRSMPAANANVDELVALADEKSALPWKAIGIALKDFILALTGNASDAVSTLTSAVSASRSGGSTLRMPSALPYLARVHARRGQFDEAWRCIGEAMTLIETTKERWCEADINRIAGEIALLSPERDAAKAEAYFERALTVARKRQAKSWELRAAMSMARLWHDQGKFDDRVLLAPVYGWFTEGSDTLDLKQPKMLLDVRLPWRNTWTFCDRRHARA